jgi:unsaturated chondroitin disaccharide hydrolase
MPKLNYANTLKVNTDSTKIPRSTLPNGTLKLVNSANWCSGFFAGNLWYLYQAKKQLVWKQAATKWTAALEKEQYNKTTHDLGFMMYCAYGTGYNLTKNTAYKKILILSAKSLASRFKPKVEVIRSWDFGKWQYPVIIDNMMNLELLFEATKLSGDSSYRNIAIAHADYDIQHHFQKDYSSYHVVDYVSTDGHPIKKQTLQGYSDETAWARGQALGLYGFTVMYRYTKDKKYLQQAEKIAAFILNHPNLPKDKVLYWDFNAPNIPNEERDASAMEIIASALLELSNYSKANTVLYRKNAKQIFVSLSSDTYTAKPGTNNNFILQHSVGRKPHGAKGEIDSPLNYADYYLEALLRYKSILKN